MHFAEVNTWPHLMLNISFRAQALMTTVLCSFTVLLVTLIWRSRLASSLSYFYLFHHNRRCRLILCIDIFYTTDNHMRVYIQLTSSEVFWRVESFLYNRKSVCVWQVESFCHSWKSMYMWLAESFDHIRNSICMFQGQLLRTNFQHTAEKYTDWQGKEVRKAKDI